MKLRRQIGRSIIKNAWGHQNQLLEYVATYTEKNINVCSDIIYPFRTQIPGLRERLEKYLESYGTTAYWFTKIKDK